MFRAQILSPWSGTGGPGDTQMPQLLVEYGPRSEAANTIVSCSVVSGQLTPSVRDMLLGTLNPNLTTVEILCSAATLGDIQADATYHILWSEEVVDAT